METTWNVDAKLSDLRELIDAPTGEIGRFSYDADGNVRHDDDAADVTSVTEHLYDGHDFDPSRGVQLNHVRHFDPTIGRWINEEPIAYDAAGVTQFPGNDPT